MSPSALRPPDAPRPTDTTPPDRYAAPSATDEPPSADTPADDDRPVTIRFAGAGKQFDDEWIVKDLDVSVPAGTILGMVGPSGCGKTTTVRLAIGVYRPDEGEVTVLGTEPAERPTAQRTAIGYLPQSPVLFDDLSLRENLNFHASLNGVKWRRRRRLREVMELVSLRGEERKLVRNASGGMKRRLALAATLVHDPPILVLDEPTAGIDPLLRRQIWDHFRMLRDEGRTVVVTTQHVNEAALCDVVVVLDTGRVIAVGTPDELRQQAFGGDVLAVTLGRVADDATITEIRALDGIVEVHSVDAYRLRVIVEHGPTSLTALQHHLDERGIPVEEAAEVPVDWDEAFIALVNRHQPTTDHDTDDDTDTDDGADTGTGATDGATTTNHGSTTS